MLTKLVDDKFNKIIKELNALKTIQLNKIQ